MKTIGILKILILGIWISGCASLKPPVIMKNDSIESYKYIFISPTNSLPELKPELVDQTLIVNYGESGRRDTGLGGYTIEVTIQFISAKSHSAISSCTAEGQGETEADDIRIAITRCLSALLSKEN